MEYVTVSLLSKYSKKCLGSNVLNANPPIPATQLRAPADLVRNRGPLTF